VKTQSEKTACAVVNRRVHDFSDSAVINIDTNAVRSSNLRQNYELSWPPPNGNSGRLAGCNVRSQK
jgi:hypothetical protein